MPTCIFTARICSVREGNVFSHVCLSVSLSVCPTLLGGPMWPFPWCTGVAAVYKQLHQARPLSWCLESKQVHYGIGHIGPPHPRSGGGRGPPPEVVVEEDPPRSSGGRGPSPRQGPDQTSWEVLLGKRVVCLRKKAFLCYKIHFQTRPYFLSWFKGPLRFVKRSPHPRHKLSLVRQNWFRKTFTVASTQCSP